MKKLNIPEMLDELARIFKILAHTVFEWAIIVFVAIVNFLAPVAGLFFVMGAFVIADTHFGQKLAKKNNEWKSRKLRYGLIEKTELYLFIFLLFYCVDYFIANNWVINKVDFEYLLSTFVALGICYFELKSMDEKIKQLRGKGIFIYFRYFLAQLFKGLKHLNNLIFKIKNLGDEKIDE